MYKRAAYKELIGFDHTWMVISIIVISGVAFPLVFFNDTFANYLKYIYINVLIGLIFSSVLVLGNLAVFYEISNKYVSDIQKFKRMIIVSMSGQFIYTIMAASIMQMIPDMIFKGTISPENTIRAIVGSMLCVFIVNGLYLTFYYMNALKKSIKKQELLKRQNVESQLEILKNQVQPHFLFNSLNTLISLIPEEPDLAVDYVQKLSKVYRYILEIKNSKLIPLQDEIDCVKAYLFMLEVRFGDNLIYEIEENLETNSQLHIVPLSLQLLVENAVKHNVISNRKPLRISIHKSGTDQLQIKNNLQVKSLSSPSTGTGLENIKSRYGILGDYTVEITKTKSIFSVTLPLIEVQ